jgi:hypothetical protein
MSVMVSSIKVRITIIMSYNLNGWVINRSKISSRIIGASWFIINAARM